MMDRIPRSLLFLFLVVSANYLAQIPYDWHLYRLQVNPRGVALLGMTLVWFLVGFWYLIQRKALGYWLTLAFLVVQFIFYFDNQIVLMFYGYGLVYHLFKLDDLVVWAVEMVGDINFVVAGYFIYYLIRNRSRFIGESSDLCALHLIR